MTSSFDPTPTVRDLRTERVFVFNPITERWEEVKLDGTVSPVPDQDGRDGITQAYVADLYFEEQGQSIVPVQATPTPTPTPEATPEATSGSKGNPIIVDDFGDPNKVLTNRFSNEINGNPQYSDEDLKDRQTEIVNRIQELQKAGESPEGQAEINKLFAEKKEISAELERRKIIKCITQQSGKATFDNTPECEQFTKTTAVAIRGDIYKTPVPLADPCGKGTLAEINNALLSFMKTLKAIKTYGQFAVSLAQNRIANISNLIRNTSSIIAKVLKTYIQRIRNWIILEIRKQIEPIIENLLPTVAKTLKDIGIQALVDNIFCAFKNIGENLLDTVGEFLFELAAKAVNVPFCAVDQWVSGIMNKLGADIEQALGPLLDDVNNIFGSEFFAVTLPNVFSIIDQILAFESYLCAKPKCPSVKSWIGDPADAIPAIEAATFIPSGDKITGFLTGEGSDAGVFGPGSIFDPNLDNANIPSSLTECDTNPFECGPPTVDIFGGGGANAAGRAVVNKLGQVVGVDLVDFGLPTLYKSPPFVTITDTCGNGSGASAYAKIDDNGRLTEIVMTNNGSGYLSEPDGSDEFDDPINRGDQQDPVNDYVVCLTGFTIASTGIGYTINDTIKITPEIENLEAAVRMTENGQIVEIQLLNSVCGITEVPDVEIESETGDGAVIVPKLTPVLVPEDDTGDDETGTGDDETGTGPGGGNLDPNVPRRSIDPNAVPTISIDSFTRRVLNPKTRREVITRSRIAGDDELKFTTSNGQINIIRVIDCVR